MSDITKIVASVEDFTLRNGVDGILVKFTDESFIVWAVEDQRHATEIKALTGETICIALESDVFPDYWVSEEMH